MWFDLLWVCYSPSCLQRPTSVSSCSVVPAMSVHYKDPEYSSLYQLENAFSDQGCDTRVNGIPNFFVAQDHFPNYRIVLDFGCILMFDKVKIRNTNNGHYKDRWELTAVVQGLSQAKCVRRCFLLNEIHI